MKEYRTIPITECGEPLVPLPSSRFVFTEPAPYAALGAPYGGASPWMLRQGVLGALLAAQAALGTRRPGCQIKLFDAYRPNSVQHFMVQHEFRQLSGGRAPEAVPEAERAALWERVYNFWAIPSTDPATPPPHSTGAALDITLAGADGQELNMGSPIDENSERSYPDHFAERDAAVHANRLLLRDVMFGAGFTQHRGEWWHFSLGDQMWAWLKLQANPGCPAVARYGRADLLKTAP